MATAWSAENDETSKLAPPLVMMRTRSPSKPRITGRLELGPKLLELIPGKSFNVSPKVLVCF